MGIIHSPLGKTAAYSDHYNRELLFAIPRSANRCHIAVTERLPFHGVDVWNAYELSWLNEKGKPMVALGEFIIPAESPNLIESKSIKLYLNSFNQSTFKNIGEVANTIAQDLSDKAGAKVLVNLFHVHDTSLSIIPLMGECIDELDIECSSYQVHPDFLKIGSFEMEETLCSHLLRSNCLVTNQPDWGSVLIHYKGPIIDRAGLLRYIVSYRNHNEFHEHCIERMFVDIMERCKPSHLTITGRYTRRGGLDINPIRSTDLSVVINNCRLIRQ